MDILLTGGQILIGCLFVYVAWYYSDKAMQHAVRLEKMRARVTALEADHASLLLQHQKLAGKFHAALARETAVTSQPQQPLTRDQLRAQHLSAARVMGSE